jgi:methionyl-tRNA formyltransferase
LRVVFFGTSSFAERIVSYLFAHGVNVVAVVVRPDKPQGRSFKVIPSAVKQFVQHNFSYVPIVQPIKSSEYDCVAKLKSFNPDLFIVAAYGEILKEVVLEIPRFGAINVHGSLLPKYRGAAPIQRCLMNGDGQTGITIIKIVLEMDAGDILEQVAIPIPLGCNFKELSDLLASISGPALIKVMDQIENGCANPIKQDSSLVTYASKINTEEAEIQWDRSAIEVYNQIRAFAPSPSAFCFIQINGTYKRLKIIKAAVVSSDLKHFSPQDLVVPCGSGMLKLLEVQLEGKKKMPIKEFLSGIQGRYKIN